MMTSQTNLICRQETRCAGKGRRGAGFTLVEVMVAVAVGSIMLAAIMALFLNQRRTLNATRQMHDMQQNVRGGMEMLSRELAMAGYGFPVYDAEAADWVTWVSGLDANPYLVSGASDDDPDELTIIGAFGDPAGTLQTLVTNTMTTLVLGSGEGDAFDTLEGSLIYINRTELARVTATSSDSLTISVHPSRDQGLRYDHPAGSVVERVEVVTYLIEPETDSFPFKPFLRRLDHANPVALSWQEMIAGDIENLKVDVEEEGGLATVSLSVRSTDKDPFIAEDEVGDSRRRMEVETKVNMVNLL